MSQRIGLSVTSLLPEKRRPGQEAAGCLRRAGTGRARGWPGRLGLGRRGEATREPTSLLSSSFLPDSSSRLGPRLRALWVPSAGGAAEAPWAHAGGSGAELSPRGSQLWKAQAEKEGGQGEAGGAARTPTASGAWRYPHVAGDPESRPCCGSA